MIERATILGPRRRRLRSDRLRFDPTLFQRVAAESIVRAEAQSMDPVLARSLELLAQARGLPRPDDAGDDSGHDDS